MVPVRLFIHKLILLSALFIYPSTAFGWTICNETSFILNAAHVTGQQGKLMPQGWERLLPSECYNINTETGQPRYVYAQSSDAHQGGIREWSGAHKFCAGELDFTANTEIDCALQGLTTRNYIRIDPSEERTVFIEPLDYEERSSLAGIQRLLRDNGHTISKIDGISGRQTSRALNTFLRDQGLASNSDVKAQLNALEQAARDKQDEIGVTVCNEAGGDVWIAMAYRLGAAWESRGWWPIKPGSCSRTHTATIKNIEAHIFALLEHSASAEDETNESPPSSENDLILRSNLAVPSQFCIAESRFSATDRESCADRGYSNASFRPLPSDKDGTIVTLRQSDFTQKSTGGLRR